MTETIDVETAIETLEEGTEAERITAVRSLLEQAEERPEEFASHLDRVCAFADDEEENVQSTVAEILAAVAEHDPSAVVAHSEVVCSLLTSDDPFVLAFATLAARRITPESPAALSDSTDRLFELLTYEKEWAEDLASSTRARALSALGDLGEVNPSLAARLDEPLAARLDDESPSVRSSAVIVLTQLGIAHPEALPTALPRLLPRLDDPDPDTQYQTLLAYAQFRHNQPSAIPQPGEAATALKQTVKQADLNTDEQKVVIEAYNHFEGMGKED